MFGLKPTRARNPLGPDRGEGWGGFSCGHALSISVRDSAVMMDAISGPEPTSIYYAPAPERPFAEEVKREPGRLRIAYTDKSPYGEAIDPEIAAAVRDVAAMLEKLGHQVEERAPKLPADPAEVMMTIVGANTALTVRQAEQRFGRTMTENDVELLTLAMAHNAERTTATDYVAAQFAGYRISRALSQFMATCDVFLAPTLCSPPLRLGELELDVARSLAYRADLAALYAGHVDVQHFGPARDVGAACLEQERITARHDVRRGLWR